MYKHTTLMVHVLLTVVHLKVCQQKIDYTSEKQVEAERLQTFICVIGKM